MKNNENLMPMTWGWWHPIIFLPAEAQQWSAERQRVVLLHELAHVKRWDCLTQTVARIVCAVYWFNPLVWLAARRMCVERERACDDLALNGGCRVSDYAGHLVEIAKSFRRLPQVAAIAMARSSGLQGRITAIVDASRSRRGPRALVVGALGAVVIGLVAAIAAQKMETAVENPESKAIRQKLLTRLQEFSSAKEKQSDALLAMAGEKAPPDFLRFFDAAKRGDVQAVTNMYDDFKKRHPQYYKSKNDGTLAVSSWQPVLEIALAYYDVAVGEPKYIQMAVDDIIGSIPPGSIYFGGHDPGRGLPTAFSKSHADADPFFTLTQNLLAETNYLQYVRRMYGGKIYMPTEEDSKKCYDEYIADAQVRMQKGQLRPGEDVKVVDNKVQPSGQVALMAINARIAKVIFDRNPDRDFYVQESFPLEWMYPHLQPNGLIMKINRRPLQAIPDEVIQRDRKFWNERVHEMVGPWLKEETSVQEIADFVEKVYVQRDPGEFQGDARFVQNEHARKMFSKFRSSIAGVFAWRATMAVQQRNAAEQERMIRAADYAFRQAYAICPTSAEALYRYVQLLVGTGERHRYADALLLAKASSKADPKNSVLPNLIRELERMKAQSDGAAKQSAAVALIPNGPKGVASGINPGFSNIVALAQEYAAAGRTNDVLRIADDLVSDAKADAAMISFAAQIYQQLNNYPKLEKALQRWTEVTPTPEAWLDYAASQALQSKQSDAIASLQHASPSVANG